MISGRVAVPLFLALLGGAVLLVMCEERRAPVVISPADESGPSAGSAAEMAAAAPVADHGTVEDDEPAAPAAVDGAAPIEPAKVDDYRQYILPPGPPPTAAEVARARREKWTRIGDGDWLRSVRVVDLDADGRPDLLSGRESRDNVNKEHGLELLLNEGDGRFRDASDLLPDDLRAAGNAWSRPTVGDWNRDGVPDAAFAGFDGRLCVLSGGPTLRGRVCNERPRAFRLVSFDFDNDGDEDLVAAGEGPKVARNDGAGEFASFEPSSDWPEEAILLCPYGGGDDERLAVVGAEGVLFVRRGGSRSQYHRFREGPLRALQLGEAMVLDSELPRHLVIMTIAAGILVVTFDRAAADLHDQVVEESWLQRSGKNVSCAMARGDVDGDGRPELVLIGVGLVLGENGGRITVERELAGGGPVMFSCDAADLDGDGDVDIVRSTGDGLDWLVNGGAEGFQRRDLVIRSPGK